MDKSELFNKLVSATTRAIKNFKNYTKHNVASRRVMHKKGWTILRIGKQKQQMNYTEYPHHAWITTNSKTMNWETVGELSSLRAHRVELLVFDSHLPTGQFLWTVNCFGKPRDEMEQSMRQAISQTNQLYLTWWQQQTLLSCWKVKHASANSAHFKTQISLDSQKIPSPRQGEYCVFS